MLPALIKTMSALAVVICMPFAGPDTEIDDVWLKLTKTVSATGTLVVDVLLMLMPLVVPVIVSVANM
jgi:hypothetical protein